MTLAEILASAAADVAEANDTGTAGPIERVVSADGVATWSVAGHPFATLEADGATATFRLDQVIADAARRTPDTDRSVRGATWVAFRPAELDGHAEDRARAWFAAAARRATT